MFIWVDSSFRRKPRRTKWVDVIEQACQYNKWEWARHTKTYSVPSRYSTYVSRCVWLPIRSSVYKFRINATSYGEILQTWIPLISDSATTAKIIYIRSRERHICGKPTSFNNNDNDIVDCDRGIATSQNATEFVHPISNLLAAMVGEDLYPGTASFGEEASVDRYQRKVDMDECANTNK